LYLEETTLPLAHLMRTHSISTIHLTSPLDEHQEAPEDQEGPATPMEDLTAQEQYPPLISFPSNLQETLNLQEYPHYCSMATEPEPMPSSENSEST